MKTLGLLTFLLLGVGQSIGMPYEARVEVEIADETNQDIAKLSELVKSRPFLERLARAQDKGKEKAEANLIGGRLEQLGNRIAIRQGGEKNVYALLARGATMAEAKELADLFARALSQEIKDHVTAKNKEMLETLDRQLKEQERVMEEKRAQLEKLMGELRWNDTKDKTPASPQEDEAPESKPGAKPQPESNQPSR